MHMVLAEEAATIDDGGEREGDGTATLIAVADAMPTLSDIVLVAPPATSAAPVHHATTGPHLGLYFVRSKPYLPPRSRVRFIIIVWDSMIAMGWGYWGNGQDTGSGKYTLYPLSHGLLKPLKRGLSFGDRPEIPSD
ncbi:hypothetical protein B0H13DRAFT_1885339 [Mycena leptocephala]|nr:hypothetical protein B0H13DRAFT_1885339 [Mycena leptocephala]